MSPTSEDRPAQVNSEPVAFTIDVAGTGVTAATTNETVPDEKAAAPLPGNAGAQQSPARETPAEQAITAQSGKPTPGAAQASPERATPNAPKSVLTIDIGGTKVKMLASGQTEPRKASSGKEFTPAKLLETIRALAHEWDYDAVSIGYPGLVGPMGPRSEPGNLGPGWVGFDFAAALGKPVKMMNDAAVQALGSYEGGRMLFLGLGTGLGSALITGHVVVPLELGQLPFDMDRTLGQMLSRRGFEKLGKSEWRRVVDRAVTALTRAFLADYVVIGGGNARNLKTLPGSARRGHNLTAFRGGFRLWSVEDVWVLAASGGETPQPSTQEALRML